MLTEIVVIAFLLIPVLSLLGDRLVTRDDSTTFPAQSAEDVFSSLGPGGGGAGV